MTPEQERALIAVASAGLDEKIDEAFDELMRLIESGVAPRDAVDQVMSAFVGDFAATMRAALGGVMQASIGTTAAAAVATPQVQAVTLSSKLYGAGNNTSAVVEGIVRRHVAGFNDARKLARDLYVGYRFRDPAAEPIRVSQTSKVIPKYMKEALTTDPKMRDKLAETYAKFNVSRLKTPELKQAYTDALKALDQLEKGYGAELLQKKLKVAFAEKMRYYAKRISETELHRAYSAKQVEAMSQDDDIEFVEIRRAPGTQADCICVLMTGRDQYGMGPGVYPKLRTPIPPFHPFCRCYLKPRLDLIGEMPGKLNEEADVYFLKRLNEKTAARVMGSQLKLERVIGGNEQALDVYNERIPGAYRVTDFEQVATRLGAPR